MVEETNTLPLPLPFPQPRREPRRNQTLASYMAENRHLLVRPTNTQSNEEQTTTEDHDDPNHQHDKFELVVIGNDKDSQHDKIQLVVHGNVSPAEALSEPHSNGGQDTITTPVPVATATPHHQATQPAQQRRVSPVDECPQTPLTSLSDVAGSRHERSVVCVRQSHEERETPTKCLAPYKRRIFSGCRVLIDGDIHKKVVKFKLSGNANNWSFDE